MNCPNCFAGLRRFTPWQPGQMTVCGACGVIIRVNDSYAALPATPEQIDGLERVVFNRLLTASCHALAKKISARSGPTVAKQQHSTSTAAAVERHSRSGLLFQ